MVEMEDLGKVRKRNRGKELEKKGKRIGKMME